MKQKLHFLKTQRTLNHSTSKTKLRHKGKIALYLFAFCFISMYSIAQGTWTAVAANCPASSGGVCMLLSDGTVICKTFAGGIDGYGTLWYRLTPDNQGSYINGTWSPIAPMINSRLYFSSQILKDGRVYVAGGEYGTGGSSGETYNPLTNSWTANPSPGAFVSDANSEILDDGRVLQAIVQGSPFLQQNKIYNPAANTYINGSSCLGYHNESTWIKLPDNSILMVDRNTTNSERYIPALNQWVADATVPVSLYDPYGLETGAGELLPDGRAFFIGSTGHTAYYTPSGTTNPGTWAAGPDLPNAQGQPDAPTAMMPNGKILLTCSAIPTSFNHFPSPTSYYEFDYSTNTYTRINAPQGGLTTNTPCYTTNLLVLPDGNILYCLQGSSTFYVYTPGGTPVAAGKPTIKKLKKVGSSVGITGTKFNGISEGACYGDDFQMATNFPIVRLSNSTNTYYARTFNWNSTGVMRGTKADTAFFTLPAGIAAGSYALSVIANGIASNPKSVTVTAAAAPALADTYVDAEEASAIVAPAIINTKIYPNPAKTQTTLQFSVTQAGHVSATLCNANGKAINTILSTELQAGMHTTTINTSRLSAGVYIIRLQTTSGTDNLKLIVQ
ncbi:T9SS type A sorting domain-containing protein [Panacibacter ginsenosidivorans]|uniref:T9SS type A sorting domain-containing protein n=1 Tax=Panacibacter ginsenosidivorans TaxID=1813871 RepID=A0A5B8VEE4_9BACT|nr:T9SS type A sorting domain-containing protein [Panacibacter ginsenosidivorans]QEC68648.1 T9SS type A sorting domain-containing protein [Panacibacter ginsenosidivorans]